MLLPDGAPGPCQDMENALAALMFGAPGTWCHVDQWLQAPWPVVRGPVFWFHSGTPELPGLACISPPLAWMVVKWKGFKILGSNIFGRLVFLGMIWNSPTFLRNGCYWGDCGRLGCLHTTHAFQKLASHWALFKLMEFFLEWISLLKSPSTMCYVYCALREMWTC